MGNIVQFPSQRAQGLAYLDRHIRQLLSARGADEALIDYAAAELTRIYGRIHESEQYRVNIRLPEGISAAERDSLQLELNAGLEAMREGNHGLLVELVAQLVLSRVQLFQLSRR